MPLIPHFKINQRCRPSTLRWRLQSPSEWRDVKATELHIKNWSSQHQNRLSVQHNDSLLKYIPFPLRFPLPSSRHDLPFPPSGQDFPGGTPNSKLYKTYPPPPIPPKQDLDRVRPLLAFSPSAQNPRHRWKHNVSSYFVEKVLTSQSVKGQ